MIFTAHMDESGTHQGSVATIMGGILGTARQLELFERRFSGLQRKYGFKVLHTKLFRQGNGEFKGWPETKRRLFVKELSTLIDKMLTGVAYTELVNDDYMEYYRDVPRLPKTRTDTAYGLAFRLCLIHFMETVHNVPRLGDLPHKLNVVLESGHRHIGDADRIFNEVRETVRAYYGTQPLGTFSTASKAEPLLQAADFVAHTGYIAAPFFQAGLDPAKRVPDRVKRAMPRFIRLSMTADMLRAWPAHLQKLQIMGKQFRKTSEP